MPLTHIIPLADVIRVEDFHISVPLTISSIVNLTRIDQDFFLGQFRKERTGVFLHTSEVDPLPVSALSSLPKALSNGLKYFLNKKEFKFSITEHIILEGTSNSEGITLYSSKWQISLTSAGKTISLFQKVADQMILSRCTGVKEATQIQVVAAQLASREDCGESVFHNWSLTTIQKIVQSNDLGMLTYILGMKEIILLACKLERLYKID